MYASLVASAVHIVAGGSITDPNSPVITKAPYKYSTHQIWSGLIFDVVVSTLCIAFMVFVWYRNYGPGARSAATQT